MSRAGKVTTSRGEVCVTKRYYFSTYDAAGRFCGTLWFRCPRVRPEELDAYRRRYGVRHPFLLPVRTGW